MHELSIALGIVDIAEEEAEQRAAVVRAIHVKLGALCGVVRSALSAAYELAREGTAVAEADLIFEEVPIIVHCSICNCDSPVASVQSLVCDRCGTPSNDIVSGRELEVVALELET